MQQLTLRPNDTVLVDGKSYQLLDISRDVRFGEAETLTFRLIARSMRTYPDGQEMRVGDVFEDAYGSTKSIYYITGFDEYKHTYPQGTVEFLGGKSTPGKSSYNVLPRTHAKLMFRTK